MDALFQDLRFAARTLLRAPAFTLVAVLCLGLGIAANVTVFSPINTLLVRPLPFADPQRVLGVYMTREREQQQSSFSYPDFRDVGDAGGAFSATGLYAGRAWNLGGLDEPQRVNGARVTASLFPMLGLRTALGRHFRPEEDEGGRVVMISHAFWQRQFGGDSSIVGRSVTINDTPYTLVGVLQEGIRFPETEDMWLPLDPAETRDDRSWRGYRFMARLAPGVTEADAQTRLAAVMRRLQERYPEHNRGWTAWLRPYSEEVASEVRPMMLILLGAVGFVLLIACANVANLLLARAAGRRREVAVRLSLGASRGRLVRQLVTESILLSVLGGAVGVLLGSWALDGIVALLPDNMPFWMTFEVDRTVLVATTVVSLVTGVLFGLVPALQATRPELTEVLKEGGRGATSGARAGRMRASLVVAEIALSLVLLVGAGLMVRSFLNTQTAQLGFEPRNLLTFETSLQGERYESDSSRLRFYDRMLERVAAVPGVAGTAAVSQLPIATCCSWSAYFPTEKQYPNAEGPAAHYGVVTPAYFETMGIRRVAGRAFDARDVHGSPPVVVVNRTLAEREWPGQNAIGRTMRLGTATDSVVYTVVGVVEDVVRREVTEAKDAQVYRPLGQEVWRTLRTVVRTSGDAAQAVPAVRAAIKELDPNLPLSAVQSMQKIVSDRMFEPRVYSFMFALFGFAALLLASIGLYGVMSYLVAQRTHEFGVRMALGAQPADVRRMVVRNGARLAAIGLLIGVPSAFALARVLRGALYGVSSSDPVTFLGIPALLAGVALLASWIPARRATRVDPATALRAD